MAVIDYLYPASKRRYDSWRSKMSPKISKFVDGLNSSNKTLDVGEVAALGLGSTRFFCFGQYDGLRDLYTQAQLWCHNRYYAPSKMYRDYDGYYACDYLESKTKYNNGFSPVGSGGTVTNAKGGQSWHNWGCAVDVYLCDSRGAVDWSINYNSLYERLGLVQWGKDCGLKWGGSWSDNGHFEDSTSHELPSNIFWRSDCVDKGYLFLSSGDKSNSASTSKKVDWKNIALIGGGVLLALVSFFALARGRR